MRHASHRTGTRRVPCSGCCRCCRWCCTKTWRCTRSARSHCDPRTRPPLPRPGRRESQRPGR
eukprot:scaffold106932_cov64-Phaeocystis_antarctica.AAC.2